MKKNKKFEATKVLIKILSASMKGESAIGENLWRNKNKYLIYHRERLLVLAKFAAREMGRKP